MKQKSLFFTFRISKEEKKELKKMAEEEKRKQSDVARLRIFKR